MSTDRHRTPYTATLTARLPAPGRVTSLVLLEFADLVTLGTAYCVALNMVDLSLQAAPSLPWLDRSISMRQLAGLGFCLLVWHVVLRLHGLYDSYRLTTARRMLRDIATAVLFATLPVAFVLGVFGGLSVHDIGVIVLFPAAAFLGLSLERLAVRVVVIVLRRLGRNQRYAVVVGDAQSVAQTSARLQQHGNLGYVVVGTVPIIGPSADGAQTIAALEALFDRHPVDEVFVDLRFDRDHVLIREITSACQEQGSLVRIVANLGFERRSWAVANTVLGQPVVTVGNTLDDPLYRFVKRVLDLLVSALVLIVLAPLFALIAIAIKLDSRGPVFFAQERVGQNRRRFHAYKFRTMVPDAEALQGKLEAMNEASGAIFKMRRDPRVTRLGAWLRRTSLDELPQFFNVLCGEMSLVGPRPLPVRDVSRIDVRWHKRRFAVKPGITCLWQVNSREPDFDKLISADMDYIDRQSFALDLVILAKTVPAVLLRHGVH
jgi:exopolysaccharide biosynthesis polyprenyl glycosylphosphotransferase